MFSFSFIFLKGTALSEADFTDITNELRPDDLQHLFHNLGILQRDIEHAEVSANTTDSRLKARAVLLQWKKNHGRDASLKALLEAKRKTILEAKRKLSCNTGT